MESRHCGQDKRIFFCPVHNTSTPCSLKAFGIRCMNKYWNWWGQKFNELLIDYRLTNIACKLSHESNRLSTD